MRASLVTLLLVLIVVRLAAALSETRRGDPCPELPLRASPLRLHFLAGLREHQSWIDFPVTEPDPRAFVLCLDHRVFDTNTGGPSVNGVVRVNISTRWIDLQWILGRLHDYDRPDRWELVYTTYSRGHEQIQL